MGRQQSSIERLPEDILERLQELLRDPRVTQLEATAKINAVLNAEGVPTRLSKSAVNRYAVRMEEVGRKLRQSREIAQMWIGRLGAEPQGEVGKLLNEMIRSLAFDAALALSEGEEAIEPRMLRDLAIAVEKLEKAASENVKRDEEIRRQERERLKGQTLQAVEEAVSSGPMTAEALKAKIREVYGV